MKLKKIILGVICITLLLVSGCFGRGNLNAKKETLECVYENVITKDTTMTTTYRVFFKEGNLKTVEMEIEVDFPIDLENKDETYNAYSDMYNNYAEAREGVNATIETGDSSINIIIDFDIEKMNIANNEANFFGTRVNVESDINEVRQLLEDGNFICN